MDKRFWRMLGSRKALTRMQAVAIVVLIVVVAIIGAVYYYTALPAPTPFSMQVIPEEIIHSIPGQRCMFLVVVADEGEGSGKGEAVNISATTSSGSVTVYPQVITSEKVAEVTVIPDKASIDGNLTVTVHGERGGLKKTEKITVEVLEGKDLYANKAAEVRDIFIPRLAANHPEFGLTNETEWTGTIVRPYRSVCPCPITQVVMYYLFFSEDWEIGVSWHVTIPPQHWAKIYLRHRFTDACPSYAFEVSSWGEREELYAINPPESVWR